MLILVLCFLVGFCSASVGQFHVALVDAKAFFSGVDKLDVHVHVCGGVTRVHPTLHVISAVVISNGSDSSQSQSQSPQIIRRQHSEHSTDVLSRGPLLLLSLSLRDSSSFSSLSDCSLSCFSSGCGTSISCCTVFAPPVSLRLLHRASSPHTGGAMEAVVSPLVEGPVFFRWSDGFQSEMGRRDDVGAGRYEVVVVLVSRKGLEGKSNALDVPGPLACALEVMRPVVCSHQDNGVVKAVVTGALGVDTVNIKWIDNGSNGLYRTQVRVGQLLEFDAQDQDGATCSFRGGMLLRPLRPLVVSITLKPRPRCEHGSSADLIAEPDGGVPPYSYKWSNGDATKQGQFFPTGRHYVTVTDAHGCQVVSHADVPSILKASFALRNVSCAGRSDGLIDLTVSGGSEPYSYLWSGGGATTQDVQTSAGTFSVRIKDHLGCSLVASATVYEPAPLKFTESMVTNMSPRLWDGKVRLGVAGGTEPYEFSWIGTGHNSSIASGLFPDHHFVRIRDAQGCTLKSVFVVEDRHRICPDVSYCREKRDGHVSFFHNCMRKIISPMLWNPRSEWSCCRGWAMLNVITEVLNREADEIMTDVGAVYLALILGDSIAHAGSKDLCQFSLNTVEPIFARDPVVYDLFKLHRDNYAVFVEEALRHVTGRRNLTLNSPVVMTVGPYGFDNEIVLASSLVLPVKSFELVTLVLKAFRFPSDYVKMSFFPWVLQVDVEYAAAFMRDAISSWKAMWVLPSDSAGILALEKVGTVLMQKSSLSPSERHVLETLQRSLTWPVSYPPAVMSKLIAGHEDFAPEEKVVSEMDGIHSIMPDVKAIEEFLEKSNTSTWYLKREYSEASRGVARVVKGDGLVHAVNTVFHRGAGVTSMDLDLKVRLFLQKSIALRSGLKPLGVRFFAWRGRLLVGHVSHVTLGSAHNAGVGYETVRDVVVENATMSFVNRLNYTGFGAAWWWVDLSGHPFLIDFNARLERHTCLNAVLEDDMDDLQAEPCYMFQKVFSREIPREDDASFPRFLRGGVKYLEPIRAVSGGGSSEALQSITRQDFPWNLRQDDVSLFSFVRQKVGNLTGAQAEHVMYRLQMEAEEHRVAHEETKRVAQNVQNRLAAWSKDWTPMHQACASGNVAMVRLLARDFPCIRFCQQDAAGMTPVDVAYQEDHKDVIKQARQMCPRLCA